jgi:hypothetical protein
MQAVIANALRPRVLMTILGTVRMAGRPDVPAIRTISAEAP